MRSILVLLLLCPAPVVLAQQEFNSQNLALAAILLDPNFDRHAHVTERLVASDPQAWEQLKDEQARQAAVETELKKLNRLLDSINLEQPFILSGPVHLRAYDLGQGGFPIESLLKSASQPFPNPEKAGRLPSHFTVLTANFGFADLWPIDRENAIEFLKSKTDDSGKTRQVGFLEQEIRLQSYTQNRYIHAAVMKVRLYNDDSRENLLFNLEEDRDIDAVFRASPLSEGITLELSAINRFFLFGQRMLSPVRPVELANAACNELEPLDDHRVFLCEQELAYGGTAILMERKFVGGLLVALDFRVTQAPASVRADNLLYLFQRELGLATDAPVEVPHCWSFHKVRFRLDEYSLRAGDASIPFLRARAEDFPAALQDLDCSI